MVVDLSFAARWAVSGLRVEICTEGKLTGDCFDRLRRANEVELRPPGTVLDEDRVRGATAVAAAVAERICEGGNPALRMAATGIGCWAKFIFGGGLAVGMSRLQRNRNVSDKERTRHRSL